MNGTPGSVHPDPHTSPGFMLWRVTNTWQRAIRAALAPLDLTHVQYVLLAVLASQDRSTLVTQADLAVQASTDPMMTSQVLRTLAAKGLVERSAHPTDGRARILGLTAAGTEAARCATRVVESADAAYFAVLGDDAPGFTARLAELDAAHGGADR